MRTTWDAAASSDRVDLYTGDPATARAELESLFSRLGDDPRGGVCVEIGCGTGRMTRHLADRFDRVVAVDVSPAMLELARRSVSAPNVEFHAISGHRLDGLDNGFADAVVCYLVLQHLPARRRIFAYLGETARVLHANGRAFVQLPILDPGLRPHLWRLLRRVAVPVAARLSPDIVHQEAYRGYRLTQVELEAGLAAAGLRVTARDEAPGSPYRFAQEVFLRLERA